MSEVMQQLTMDAIEAKQKGLSYGQLIASRSPKPQTSSLAKEEARGQQKRLCCALCGTPIPPKSLQRKYCSVNCADIAREKQQYVNNAKRRGKYANK